MSLPVATVWDASSGALAWVAYAACTLALLPAGARWLRVAQREHYLAGSATRFALRWWASEPGNIALAFVGVAGLALSFAWPLAALAAATVAAVGPWRLSVRGRTSPLVWTRRLRTLAAVWGLAEVVVLVAGVLAGLPAPFAAAAALLAPVLVDLACALAAPLERRLAAPFVERAQQRLARVAPTIIGITGSYGKTSTKNHVAYLVAGTKAVVATPRSYNNMAGLARSVNEQLAEGTEVFVAEMGTYGPGEIAAMCAWCPPEIAVLTTIGPVHLERMGSLDKILENKAEITESASTVVLNVDDERLARLAERLAPTVRVLRCSAVDAGADGPRHRGRQRPDGRGRHRAGERRPAHQPRLCDRRRHRAGCPRRGHRRTAPHHGAGRQPPERGGCALGDPRHRRHVQRQPGRRRRSPRGAGGG
jgi:UDP-N-acetylmuramoyl-tripeptide--D-alanyl-D-alanine ligase